MPSRLLLLHALFGCCLGLGALTPAPAATASIVRWTYEAVGDDAPKREHFVVRPDAVEWLDEQGRVIWRLERRTATLVRMDPQHGSRQVMDEAAMASITGDLAKARRLGLGAVPEAGKPARAWAGVEAADRWTLLQDNAQVAGMACRRLALHVSERTVGEACIADARTQPGGPALLEMLQALLRLADELNHRLGTAGSPTWPLHPLVTAARTGGVPLRVVESLPGERPREWRLAGRPAGSSAP